MLGYWDTGILGYWDTGRLGDQEPGDLHETSIKPAGDSEAGGEQKNEKKKQAPWGRLFLFFGVLHGVADDFAVEFFGVGGFADDLM